MKAVLVLTFFEGASSNWGVEGDALSVEVIESKDAGPMAVNIVVDPATSVVLTKLEDGEGNKLHEAFLIYGGYTFPWVSKFHMYFRGV